MRIALLTLKYSIHSTRWVNSLANRGHEVHLISMHKENDPLEKNIIQHKLSLFPPWGYYLDAHQLRKILDQVQPDLLHAHFASGYGTLARLSHFHPMMISVWGNDVYNFPFRSPIHHEILRENLCTADWISSTSQVMAEHTTRLAKCVKEKISVIPFGIDCEFFKPQEGSRDPDFFTIGTVKTMAPKYGIDVLIRAFHSLHHRLQSEGSPSAGKLRLILVGGGPIQRRDDQTPYLKKLCQELGIQDKVTFVGPVPHKDVPGWLNRFDVYAALSTKDSESFGVAVIEASACEIPVVVTKSGGLPEVVRDGVTGYIVPTQDHESAAEAFYKLFADQELREKLGNAGRGFVLNHYEWERNVSQMETLYASVVNRYRNDLRD